jgi:uncharacterized protein DUF4304
VTKSVYAEHLDLVQTQISGLVCPLGLRKTGRTYNRPSAEGLTQVINLQIARPDPVPPSRQAAGERSAPSDRFTVNLGVWIPEVSDYHLMHPRSRVIQEYDCQVRTRLGALTAPGTDPWWPLDERWPDAAAEIVRLLHDHGLPWLEHFGTRDCVLTDWVDQAPDARIVRAIIHARRGQTQEARALLAEQAARTRQPSHRTYVQAVANQLGLGVLPSA